MKRNHRELRAWKEAIALVSDIYLLTARFPDTERYGLTSQMRRAAVSVPANIAEGAARSGTKELAHFLSIASGSLSELDTLVEVAKQLGYLTDEAPDPGQDRLRLGTGNGAPSVTPEEGLTLHPSRIHPSQ